jgi:YD repeat-containing protein
MRMRLGGAMGAVVALAVAAGAQEAPREVAFQCDGSGRGISVTFADGQARLLTRGTTIVLDGQPVGSGMHYAGGGHDLRGKGDALVWTDPAGEIQMCEAEAAAQDEAASPGGLAGTAWTLVHFQSMDGAIGTVTPPRPGRYTMTFGEDGTLALRLDCNRGSASWSVAPEATADGGQLTLGAAMMTRAACGEGALDVQIARDLERVRSYTIADGQLNLALEADSGLYTWRPAK